MAFCNGRRSSARPFYRSLFAACAVTALLLPSAAQDPLKRYPQNYQLIFDNAQVSVIHVHYGPHERLAPHDHSDFPTLFVYLSDSGPVRFRMEGVPPATFIRPAVSLGSFRYSPGGVERHSVQSLSEHISDFLRIELKEFPLAGGEAFRHGAPASLNADMDDKEFSNEEVDVERVVCLAGSQCTSAAAATPSLVVALSDVRVENKTETTDEKLNAGETRWIAANGQLSVSASSAAPAHLLRIFIKPPRTRAPVS